MSNSPPIEPSWTSLPTSVIENNPNNVHNTIINDSIPPIPPSLIQYPLYLPHSKIV